MFKGGKGIEEGEFDSPTGIAVDGSGNVLVADTGNGRIEKFSPTGTFLSIIGRKGSGQGQLAEPNGIAIDRSWQHLRCRSRRQIIVCQKLKSRRDIHCRVERSRARILRTAPYRHWSG